VVCLALYARRLPVAQATRVSVVKAAANGFGALVPCGCALLWTAGYHPTADGTTDGVFHPYSASTNKRALMLVRRPLPQPRAHAPPLFLTIDLTSLANVFVLRLTCPLSIFRVLAAQVLASTGLLPLCTLLLVYRRQRLATGAAATSSDLFGLDGNANPATSSAHTAAGSNSSSASRPTRGSRHGHSGGNSGGGGLSSSSEEDYVHGDELDLESYFMDYRLKQMQEKLAAAAREIEGQMEEYDFGTDDDEEEDDPFGEREEAAGLLADV
jgi:uncharacterized membrane protein YgcG